MAVIPAGYMAKRVSKPDGLGLDGITDVYSVSSHVNDNFADYIEYWKHNAYWLFDSPEVIRSIAEQNSIEMKGTSLFYYEVYENEFDGEKWLAFEPEKSFHTSVVVPSTKILEGFDVVTFWARSSPECLPLSCNDMASELPKQPLSFGFVRRGIHECQQWNV